MAAERRRYRGRRPSQRRPAPAGFAETSTQSWCSPRPSGRGRSSRSATGRPRSPSCSWSWWRSERPARDHARRPARDPRAPAQQGVPRLDAAHAPDRRRINRASGSAVEGADVPRCRHGAGARRPRRCPSARSKTVRRREGAPAGRRIAGRRTARTRGRAGRRAAAPLGRSDRLPHERRREGSSDRRHRGSRPSESAAAGTGADDRNAPSAGHADDGRANACRIRRLPAAAHVARDLRPVGGQRRGRGEEQPRRRDHPLDGPAAPPARRQGDRDRPARARAARSRRGPRRRRSSWRASSTPRPGSVAAWRSSSPGSRSGSRSTRSPTPPRAPWPPGSRTRTRQDNLSRTRSSPSTSPATSPSRATWTARSRTSSPSSR